MNDDDILNNCILESVTVGNTSASLNFYSTVNGEHCWYYASSMYEICFHVEGVFKEDIINNATILDFWNYFGKAVSSINVLHGGRVCELVFDFGRSIYIWSKDSPLDNLLIIRRECGDRKDLFFLA